jgi:hypothetical protein
LRECLFRDRDYKHCRCCNANGMMSGEKHRRGWMKYYRKGIK